MWTNRRGRALSWDLLLGAAALLFVLDAFRNPERLYTSLVFALLAVLLVIRKKIVSRMRSN